MAEQKSFIAPDNYRRLSEPFESEDAANEAMSSFWKELYELRNKYRIQNMTAILNVSVSSADGDGEFSVAVDMHAGDQLMKESMLAWSLGRAQLERQERIGKLLARPIQSGRDRP